MITATNRRFIIAGHHYNIIVDNLMLALYTFTRLRNETDFSPTSPERTREWVIREDPMNRKLTIQTVVLVVLAALTTLGLTTRAGAVQGDKKIRLLDDCDPVTFNAV